MAKFVVPSRKKEIIVCCHRCKTLYVPEKMSSLGNNFFEECPVCHATCNDWNNVIPLWKYNLIKLFRTGLKKR